MPEETYLGDGLYASFDGFQIRLRAPSYCEEHIVYLDPDTLSAFLQYVEKLKEQS